MTEIEKLRALLPHWIEHNHDHAAEFGRWADTAEQAGHRTVAEGIRAAMDHARLANDDLQKALDDLGGPLPLESHHHAH